MMPKARCVVRRWSGAKEREDEGALIDRCIEERDFQVTLHQARVVGVEVRLGRR